VVVGVGATVLGPVRIGKKSIIGAGALVMSDVPENSRVQPPLATLILAKNQAD